MVCFPIKDSMKLLAWKNSLSPSPDGTVFLPAYGGFFAVPGEEDGLLRQSEDFVPDGSIEYGLIASRKIRAPEAAGKNGIPHKGNMMFLIIVDAAVRGVAGVVDKF